MQQLHNEQGVRLQPNNASAFSNLGYAYDRLDKAEQSIQR
jgi:Flp pilus assembly protein TadD